MLNEVLVFNKPLAGFKKEFTATLTFDLKEQFAQPIDLFAIAFKVSLNGRAGSRSGQLAITYETVLRRADS